MLNLEPKRVFDYFEEISQIPRGSGNEKAISDYLVAFAKDRGLAVVQDKTDSVLITKPATAGMENAPGVIIQGHMDMVCVKEPDSSHDFLKDPIELLVDGDLLTANQTTLGADNGIAVAMGLALLDSSDIPHPHLEVVITTNEEVNMNGALHFDTSLLKGKYFINVDSEEEGEITIGCAGGLKAMLEIPYQRKALKPNKKVKELIVKGLKGGHSGAEIHTNRGNSHKLMGRLLSALHKEIKIDLIEISGGIKDNVIPSHTTAVIAVDPEEEAKFNQICQKQEKEWKNELSVSDPKVQLTIVDKLNADVQKINKRSANKLIFLLNTLPNGVQTMSSKLPGMVESSLNIGVIQMLTDKIILSFATRANVGSLKQQINSVLQDFAEMNDLSFSKTAEYPEWEMKPESLLLQKAIEVYKDLTGKEAVVKAIHAGLECGVFLSGKPELEAISIGPDMWEVHSVNERLSISSTQRTWEYLKALLAELGK
ncbi:aminoacyl-histidine dipeptidase [Clostridiales bacterium COT073_COT-073]|nr:aminoacyl-histidine dipeptidase [Clostridiales bacterium COT073_COT-073]